MNLKKWLDIPITIKITVFYCTCTQNIYFVVDSKNKYRSKKSLNLDIKRTKTSVIYLSVNLSYSFDKYLVN